jgi:hypothetical protein
MVNTDAGGEAEAAVETVHGIILKMLDGKNIQQTFRKYK